MTAVKPLVPIISTTTQGLTVNVETAEQFHSSGDVSSSAALSRLTRPIRWKQRRQARRRLRAMCNAAVRSAGPAPLTMQSQRTSSPSPNPVQVAAGRVLTPSLTT